MAPGYFPRCFYFFMAGTKTYFSFCLIALSVFLILGCGTSKYATNPAVNYTQYETYSIAKSTIISSENPLFEWTQLSDRIKKDLHFHLPSVGLDRASIQTEPDLRIYFYIIHQADATRPVFNYTVGWRAQPFLEQGEAFAEYPQNTLVLDFIDHTRNELVWRGSIPLSFEEEAKAYESLSQKLKTLVRRYPSLPVN